LGVHRNGYGGALIHAMDCAYRFYAVQDERFDLGVRPLGVKAIVRHGGQVLLGRRAQSVHAYAGKWEFVPGGMVEPDASLDVSIVRELDEEAGMKLTRPPVAAAVLYDRSVMTWDVVYMIEVPGHEFGKRSGEHDQLAWRPIKSVLEVPDLSRAAELMATVLLRNCLPDIEA
jgi:ADP-ribose pyrophosphatase YjhB (NUDIX family)